MLAIDRDFELVAPHSPTGDQPAAIADLTARLERGDKAAVLLGATGTGKTFTMAHLIQRLRIPQPQVRILPSPVLHMKKRLRSHAHRRHQCQLLLDLEHSRGQR